MLKQSISQSNILLSFSVTYFYYEFPFEINIAQFSFFIFFILETTKIVKIAQKSTRCYGGVINE